MKKLGCYTAVALSLALAAAGEVRAEAQLPASGPPGTLPAARIQGASPSPTVKKTVARKRVRARVGLDNIANQLNAQQLTAGVSPAVAPGYPPGAYPGVMAAAYPSPAYYPPPPPFWYPPPRPWFWRPWPWWRPWRPYGWW